MKKATRSDLVKLGAEKVRSAPNLFNVFKDYLEEDAKHIYANGQIPNGCFSCSFNSNFEKWKRYVIKSGQYTSNKIIMSNKNSTYELLDRNTRVYFKGEVLDRNSSDEAWNIWINYPTEDDKIAKRKAVFNKLPNSKPEDKSKDSGSKKEEENKKEDETKKEPSTDTKEPVKEPENTTKENKAEPAKEASAAAPVKKTRKVAVKADNTIKKTRRTSNS